MIYANGGEKCNPASVCLSDACINIRLVDVFVNRYLLLYYVYCPPFGISIQYVYVCARACFPALIKLLCKAVCICELLFLHSHCIIVLVLRVDGLDSACLFLTSPFSPSLLYYIHAITPPPLCLSVSLVFAFIPCFMLVLVITRL